jgi:hypothetical protein
MEKVNSKWQVTFGKLLRAYQTGGICRDELLRELDHHLDAGAVCTDLLDTLRRRESVEPLDDHVYLAIWSRLRRAVKPAAPTLMADPQDSALQFAGN